MLRLPAPHTLLHEPIVSLAIPAAPDCIPVFTAHAYPTRRRAESLARFEQREAELKEANDAALRQWTERKVRQHRADAEDSYMRQIQMKAMAAYRQRM